MNYSTKQNPKNNGVYWELKSLWVFILLNLLYCCSIKFDSSIPFLTFTFYTITHKLVPSNYFKPLTKTQLKLHNEIVKLQKKGLSYRKIHKELINKGFKIGKSPSTVHSIIKKREKRDKFLNQPVVEGYKDFDILFYKVRED